MINAVSETGKRIFPTFLGIGAAKTGSTSLYRYLGQHPEVFMSPIKEVNFFSTDINEMNFMPEVKRLLRQERFDRTTYFMSEKKEHVWEAFGLNAEEYISLFDGGFGFKARGEVSNSYLYSKVAAENIAKFNSKMRLFAVLRNPIERAYSQYLANVRDGRTILSFMDELEKDKLMINKGWYESQLYLELGLYADQIKRFQNYFNQESLLVILHEELTNDPKEVLRRVCGHIGVASDFNFDLSLRHNEGRQPKFLRFNHLISSMGIKKPLYRIVPSFMKDGVKDFFFKEGRPAPMAKEDKAILLDFYRNDIERLALLLDRDLSSWLVL